MQKLKANELIHISTPVFRSLVQNRITTILEFLQEDVIKLTNITKLKLPEILAVRNEIFKKYSAPILNGITLLDKKLKFFSTGIPNLDRMLKGGLQTGTVTELCGLADSGKTQLCFQLAINCAKRKTGKILYIDTKGDFSAIRIQRILEATSVSHKDMAEIMFKIKVIRVWTLEETIELIQSLKNKNIIIDNLTLIIIDSLPCLMLQYLGDDNKVGLSLLNTLVNYSRYLCQQKNICMICVNIQTRWVDQDIADLDDDGDASTLIKETFVEKRNRCLGKYWQQIPSLVLLLDKINSNSDKSTEVVISVDRSNIPSIKSKRCSILISHLGVT